MREHREKWIDPSNWVSLKPFGLGERKPNNYLEIWRAFQENRGRRRYAWDILRHGTCDGCALGTKGMHDWTMSEVHLCNIRLRLLRLNTMPELDLGRLADVSGLAGLRGAQLRELGRLPQPMRRRAGEPGFTPVSWDEALNEIGAAIGESRAAAGGGDRIACYMTSRGEPNENYFAAQKSIRALGSASIDSSARICHSPSTFGLKDALGVAATTCSYSDWIGSDLVVFIGSNPATNEPVAMKYLYHAKKAGTKVAVINAYREPGMERYWVPSNVESAVFGTKISDRFFGVGVGGDIGFLNGAFKYLVEHDLLDRSFVAEHTAGFEAAAEAVAGQDWEELEALAGTSRDEMAEFARMLAGAKTAVLVWSMGITQHAHGEDAVRAIINLGLTKGFVGRPNCGLMPIRGHSGVQGGAEMGAYSTALPGGLLVTPDNAEKFSKLWEFEVPGRPGLTTSEMIDAAHEGKLDVLISSGGNFLEVLPDPDYCREALAKIPLRVHIDICLSSQMLTDPAGAADSAGGGDSGGTVLLLPAQTRYEMAGGVTETSTERRVIFSPEIEGPRVAGAWPEWQIFTEMVARARPELAGKIRYDGTAQIRADIAAAVPSYEGIDKLAAFGDAFQYGGPHLCAGWVFPTADGKAHFSVVGLPSVQREPGKFTLATRRGKQFNSMVHETRDAINGAERDSVLMNPADASGQGLADGDPVKLVSATGAMAARVMLAPVTAGTLQVHWPEGEVLIDRRRRSPQARIPDYNTLVTIERA